jgi:hypothetical protein
MMLTDDWAAPDLAQDVWAVFWGGAAYMCNTKHPYAKGHRSSYHRVFSQRRWSASMLARLLITLLLDHVIPPGPVLLAASQT